MFILYQGVDGSLNVRWFVLAVTESQILSCRKGSAAEPRFEPSIVQDLVTHATVFDSTLNNRSVHRVDGSNIVSILQFEMR